MEQKVDERERGEIARLGGKGLGYLKPASRFYKVFAVSTECEN